MVSKEAKAMSRELFAQKSTVWAVTLPGPVGGGINKTLMKAGPQTCNVHWCDWEPSKNFPGKLFCHLSGGTTQTGCLIQRQTVALHLLQLVNT